MARSIFKNRLARSTFGNIVLVLFLASFGFFMLLPFIYTISTSLKPMNELWLFPPRFLVQDPTFDNFKNLFNIMSNSWVPFSRYLFNTVLVTVFGTVGHIIISAMCAYSVSLYKFPGSRFYFKLVRTSLMFSAAVTAIPSFIVMTKLDLIDTYWSLILPALGSSMGFFMMKQFMDQSVNKAVLESADIDGANELQKFFKLVMPMVKPAWLTLMIFQVQALWHLGNTPYIYNEELKTLTYAMNQIQAGGIARTGVAAAITVCMMAVPLLLFIISQSSIIETMSASGLKD